MSTFKRPSFSGKNNIGIGISGQRQFSHQKLGTAFLSHKQVPFETIKQISHKKCTTETQDDTLYSIIHRALSYLHLEKQLNHLSSTHASVTRLFPYQLYDILAQDNGDVEIHRKRLDTVLQSFELDSHDVPHDGDCLFACIAVYLHRCFTIVSEGTNLIVHLKSLNILPSMSQSDLIKKLRELLVDEWLSNRDFYEPFFCLKKTLVLKHKPDSLQSLVFLKALLVMQWFLEFLMSYSFK